jgi:hypothetical protein
MNDKFSAVDVSKANETTPKPEAGLYSGKNLGDSRLLPRWCPAYRQHEPDPGSRLEHVKARPDTEGSAPRNERGGHARGRIPSGGIREGLSTDAGRAGGLARSSCDPPAYRSGMGSQGAGSSR